jgi:uncharacterized membrane-anchored protein
MQILMKELFTSDVGLMSFVVIAFTLGMGVYYTRYFLKHVRDDSAQHRDR